MRERSGTAPEDQREGLRRRLPRRTTIVSMCLVGALAVGLATWAVTGAVEPSAASGTTSHASDRGSAEVARRDLADVKTFSGTLGYGAPIPVPGAAAGTLTWLPRPGDVIGRDAPLYAVDERPVRSMYGAVPLWRTLALGVEGADVQQLNENLAALGYDVAVDRVFGKRTLAAVRQWQRDRGLAVTGSVTAQDVAFVDGEVRVASVSGTLGSPAAGDVLSVTTTERIVSTTVGQADAERLTVGTAVRLRVNGVGDPIEGTVSDVAPTEDETAGPMVTATISFDPGDRALPSAASVQVEASGTTEEDVLTVPVAALVAGRGGKGFSVDVVRRGGTTERVPVEVGLVAEGHVAVTGALHEGDRVVVPS